MNDQRFFYSYLFLVFNIIFFCLPFRQGNVEVFFILLVLCLWQKHKHKITYSLSSTFLLSGLGWIFLSIFWALDVKFALNTFLKITFATLGGWIWWNTYRSFDETKKIKIQKTVFSAALLIGVLIALDMLRCKIFGYQYAWFKLIKTNITNALSHGCIACALGIWIGLLNLSRWWRAIILVFLSLTLIYATSDAAALAIIFGGLTLAIHKLAPHFVRFMFIYGMPTIWITMPFIFNFFNTKHFLQWASSIDTSYTHRLFIWYSISKQIFQKFWIGFGLGSSRYRYCYVKPKDITIWVHSKPMTLEAPETCLHPHNFMMQIWLELGAIGVLICCFAWVIYWHNRYKRCDSHTMAFWGSALCVAATSISVWQTWWLVLLVTLIPIYHYKIIKMPATLANLNQSD